MKLHEKIASILEKRGRGAQRRLAEYLGDDPAYINRWIKGTRPVPYKKLKKIADFLNVSTDYLLDETNKTPIIRYVPLVGGASCGTPADFQNEPMKQIPVLVDANKDYTYAIVAEDESMSPRIKQGDIVICDKYADIDNGDIVHYIIDEKQNGIRKAIYIDNSKIALMPLNMDCKSCKPTIVDLNEHTVELNRCIKIIADL